jgi:hypothetical protein
VDVTDAVRAAVTGGQTEVSFALAYGSSNLITFSSKDKAVYAPQLVIVR